MALIFYLLVLLVSFYLLAQICDRYFVESLDRIATRFGLSSDVAGATLMAMGSSAPELFVALIAVFRPGHEQIGTGTIVGSALFNVLAIIGAVAVVKQAKVAWQPVVRDLLFYSVAILLLFWAFYDSQISLVEAGVFIVAYIVYVFSVSRWRKWFHYQDKEPVEEYPETEASAPAEGRVQKLTRPLDWLLARFFPSAQHYFWIFLISIVLISGLSWVLVESAIHISLILKVPEVIIALTVIAVGTSVPDLISSIIVARQNRGGMAISNAIGSNIFDVLIGLGFPWLLILLFSGQLVPVKRDELSLSVIILLASVAITFAVLKINGWKLGKRVGVFFIAVYSGYIVWEVLKLYFPGFSIF